VLSDKAARRSCAAGGVSIGLKRFLCAGPNSRVHYAGSVHAGMMIWRALIKPYRFDVLEKDIL
jgi:hypothetical protein